MASPSFQLFLQGSVLWRCWLGGRKGIRPVKNSVIICLERGADLHMAQLMPLPLTVSCFSKIQIGFTFLVPAYPGSHRQMAVKRVYVCMSAVCPTRAHKQWNVKMCIRMCHIWQCVQQRRLNTEHVCAQVICLLGEEDVKLTPDQLSGIMSVIHKEKMLEESRQQEERKHQQILDEKQQSNV